MNPGFCLGSLDRRLQSVFKLRVPKMKIWRMERFLAAAATRSVFVGLKSGTEVFLGPLEPPGGPLRGSGPHIEHHCNRYLGIIFGAC